MFGISWPELFVIGVVALIVIGPKDLPPLMRRVGKMARQGRAMWDEMRGHFDDLTAEADIAAMQREAETIQKRTNAPYLEGDAEPPAPEAMSEEDELINPPSGRKKA